MIPEEKIKAENGELKGREKLFHIRADAWGERRIPWRIPVLDAKEKLHLWTPLNGEYVEMKTPDEAGSFLEGICFAEPNQPHNFVWIKLFHLMYQRNYGGDIMRWIVSMIDDLYILAIEIAKIDLYYRLVQRKDLENWEVQRFVWSELEYTFIVCRSLFDLLQRVACSIWDRLVFDDKARVHNQLPESFSDMVKNVENENVELKYGIFPQWKDFYRRHADFFRKLRKYRGDIIHQGKRSELVIVLPDKGFATDAHNKQFKNLGAWKEETFFNKNLAPLRPIIAFVIYKTLEAIEDFANVIKGLPFPEEIAPGYDVIMIGPYIHRLNQMKEVLAGKAWEADWVDEERNR